MYSLYDNAVVVLARYVMIFDKLLYLITSNSRHIATNRVLTPLWR